MIDLSISNFQFWVWNRLTHFDVRMFECIARTQRQLQKSREFVFSLHILCKQKTRKWNDFKRWYYHRASQTLTEIDVCEFYAFFCDRLEFSTAFACVFFLLLLVFVCALLHTSFQFFFKNSDFVIFASCNVVECCLSLFFSLLFADSFSRCTAQPLPLIVKNHKSLCVCVWVLLIVLISIFVFVVLFCFFPSFFSDYCCRI